MHIIETPHRGLRSRHDTGIFEKKELSNGVPVWIQKSPILLSEEGILVAYFVNVGDVLDAKGKEGVAHFLEHMPFKGTTKFPDNQVMTEFVRSRGGNMNAATARFFTKYYLSMPQGEFSAAVEVISEMLTAPLMRQEDFEVERGVIESERQRKFEHGASLAAKDIDELLYGNHPAMTWGIGSAESIAGITLEDIKAFWDAYYHAGNLQLVVGGTFAERPDLMELLEAGFGSMARKDTVKIDLPSIAVPEPRRSRIVDARYGRERFSLEWLVPGVPSVSSLDALGLLCGAYAGGMDAPLAVELRDKRGLVYESGLMEGGRVADIATRITLDLPIPATEYEEVSKVAMKLLGELSDERVTAVLDRWQVGRLKSFYYPTSLCTNLGGELVNRGRIMSVHEDEAETDDIDLDLVHQWKEFLTTTSPAVVETSPKA